MGATAAAGAAADVVFSRTVTLHLPTGQDVAATVSLALGAGMASQGVADAAADLAAVIDLDADAVAMAATASGLHLTVDVAMDSLGSAGARAALLLTHAHLLHLVSRAVLLAGLELAAICQITLSATQVAIGIGLVDVTLADAETYAISLTDALVHIASIYDAARYGVTLTDVVRTDE